MAASCYSLWFGFLIHGPTANFTEEKYLVSIGKYGFPIMKK